MDTTEASHEIRIGLRRSIIKATWIKRKLNNIHFLYMNAFIISSYLLMLQGTHVIILEEKPLSQLD